MTKSAQYFFKPKHDESIRIIIDLTNVNEHIQINQHKLETFKTVLSIIKNKEISMMPGKSPHCDLMLKCQQKKFLGGHLGFLAAISQSILTKFDTHI